MVQWLRLCAPNAGVQFLVGELRSCMPSSVAKKKKRERETERKMKKKKTILLNRKSGIQTLFTMPSEHCNNKCALAHPIHTNDIRHGTGKKLLKCP